MGRVKSYLSDGCERVNKKAGTLDNNRSKRVLSQRKSIGPGTVGCIHGGMCGDCKLLVEGKYAIESLK